MTLQKTVAAFRLCLADDRRSINSANNTTVWIKRYIPYSIRFTSGMFLKGTVNIQKVYGIYSAPLWYQFGYTIAIQKTELRVRFFACGFSWPVGFRKVSQQIIVL